MDLSNLDVEGLAKIMDQTNPVEILQQIGLSFQDAQKASQGDFSVIGKDLNKPQELDFDVIMKNYSGMFNRKLIEYFFLKSKNSEPFTDEETKTYKKVYEKWFDFIFELGKYNVFLLDDGLPDSRCINIKVGEDHFGMIKVNNLYLILLQETS